MKNLFLLLCLIFSLSLFGQSTLPQVDSVKLFEDTRPFETSYEIKNGNLYWQMPCSTEDSLLIYFSNEENYQFTCQDNCENQPTINIESGLMKIGMAGYGIIVDSMTLQISDNNGNNLFKLYLNRANILDVTDLIIDSRDRTNNITLCDQFGDSEIFLTKNPSSGFRSLIQNDENMLYGHIENGKLEYYRNIKNISLSPSDSIIFRRTSGSIKSYDGNLPCLYLQKEDTITIDTIKIFKGTNTVHDYIELHLGYPNTICPGDTTYVKVKDNVDSGDLVWYEANSTQFYKTGSGDSLNIYRPGRYILSEYNYRRTEDGECPDVSNAVVIEEDENCKGYISGYVYQNTSTFRKLGGVLLRADNGQLEVTDRNGDFEFSFDKTNLISKIEIADDNYYYNSITYELDPDFPLGLDVYNNRNYIRTYFLEENDLGITLNSGRNRPGFTIPYYITVSNKSKNEQTTDVTIRLDDALSYTYKEGEIAPYYIKRNMISWGTITVASGSSERITFYATLDKSTPLGSNLKSTVELSLSDDDANNNIDTLISEVTGSFDPNDKLVSFNGYASQGFVHDTTIFEYTVRFQNTGSDTAFTVRIEDVIDSDFDLSSIQVIDASHNYRMTIDNDTVNWIFEDILLVDSTTNEPASHGFVRFQIAQNANNPIGTMLSNQASIFFDFNDPIITNEVVNEVGEPEIVSAFEMSNETNGFAVYPNPVETVLHFSQSGKIRVYDAMGNILINAKIDNQLDANKLVPGVYFYEFSTSNAHYKGRFIKN